jgi:hypothetical protein
MSVPYLSDEWVDAADELLRSSTLDPPVDEGFTIETVVTLPHGPARRYVLAFEGSTIRARRPGDDEHATVRFTQPYGVATAIARGDLSAQAAFLDARIQVGGDITTLIGNARLLGLVGDVLAPLRADTDFGAGDA